MVTDLPDYEKKVIVVTIPGEYPALMEVDVVKVDGVPIATPTVVGCLPVSIEHTVDINLLKLLGSTIKTPTVANCLPTSIEHTVDINHKQILGEALKTPTFANCVPTSIENDAIAYDAVNDRFKVDLAKISATDVLAISATDLDIRNLVSTTDSVEVKQATAANLKATVEASNLDIRDLTSVSDSVEVKQATAANLKATVEASNLDIRDLTSVSDSVEVKQATASNLNANVNTKHDLKTYKMAVFDASASGNLVDAVADKVIKLHAMTIQAQGTVTVNLNNGSGGASRMEWSFQAREGAVIPFAPAPAYWCKTDVNTALYVTLSAAVVVTITAIYSDDDAS